MDVIYKNVVLGDLGVGKSCLVNRYVNDTFRSNYVATVGLDYYEKSVYSDEEKDVKMTIWDVSGSENFLSIWAHYYMNAVGVVLVYDTTNLESFKNILKWYGFISERAHTSAVFMLAGTKSDLKENREVSTEYAESFAKYYGFLFFETSSLSNENVKQLFKKLHDVLYERKLSRIFPLDNQSDNDSSTKESNEDTSITNLKEPPNPEIKKKEECCSAGKDLCLWRWLVKR